MMYRLSLPLCCLLAAVVVALAACSGSEKPAPGRVAVVAVAPGDTLMAHSLDSLMRQPQRLDTSLISIAVFDLTASRPVWGHRPDTLLPPASCMKIATAVAALRTLGLEHEYRTSLQIRGTVRGDTLFGSLLLVADDDPLLDDFQPLTAALRRTGVRHVAGPLWLRLAREDTLRPHPSAKVWDIPLSRTPPLLRGRRYVERQLRYALTRSGVTIASRHEAAAIASAVPRRGRYRRVALVSHKLRDVVTPMLIHSSNIKADAVLYHLDRHQGLLPAGRQRWDITHATALYWQRHAEDALPRGCVVNDGSGLSPLNRLTAQALVVMLRHAYAYRPLRDYLMGEALATPGAGERRGSLGSRLALAEYRGRVFCKTGTMTTIGGSSLAGYILGRDGHWYAFAVVNADSPVAESRLFQDRLCKTMLGGRGR